MAQSAPTYERLHCVHKTIGLRTQHPKEAVKISERYGLSPVASRILAARGFKCNKQLEDYLDPTLNRGLPEPSELKNLDRACRLIAEVTQKDKPVAICCDFDVDGLSGGSQLHHFLSSLGISSRVFVPDRFEDGYGLNAKMVEQIAQAGIPLVITVDYGTTNKTELEQARRLGLQTIVVDHHHVGASPPPCDVFINPQQEGCGFAGGVLSAAGLAWYLLVGLKQALPKAKPVDVRSYLDLACLGTVCDMVPLVGANRVIARRGLELLGSTSRAGLVALKKVAGVKTIPTCYDVSFGLGPRINAAGRIVHGDVVIELLTTSDGGRAQRIAQKLNKLNLERQEIELKVKEKAIRKLQTCYGADPLPAALVVWDEDFHTGVVGIVAQRLVETFYRPAAVLGLDEEGIFRGSVRGIKGLSVVETLAAVSRFLIKFGGHEGAGGFSVEKKKLEQFSQAFITECEKRTSGFSSAPCVEADTEAELGEISIPLIDELNRFSPFGVGNPGPLLLGRKLQVMDVRDIKGQHLKAILSDGKRYITGIMWRQNNHPALVKGAMVDAAFRADFNNFNGLTELQAVLQAVERAE